MSLLSWYRKKCAEAYLANQQEGKVSTPYVPNKEPEKEVFSEEFKWVANRIMKDYSFTGFSSEPDIYYSPIDLTGRWKTVKSVDGTSELYLEVITSVKKVRDYLGDYSNLEQVAWLHEDKIEVKAVDNVTINNCGE